jgi:transcription initiation factor TFIIH subunit 3
MNAIDATDRNSKGEDTEPPSLLTIIIDTNPHAWNLLQDSLPLSKVIVNLLVLINAHLAINHANKVAVLASHSERAVWLYPAATVTKTGANENGVATDTNGYDQKDMASQPVEDANKYRPFAHIENVLTKNLRDLMNSTTADALSSSPTTMMAGALTMALTYISKQSATLPTGNSSSQFNYSDPNAVAGGNDVAGADPSRPHAGSMSLVSRILIFSVSGDLANQYIPIMNAIFACQRLNIPIDILKLAGDTVFLQQAADATGGVYMALDASTRAGLLQYLMFAYLPDQTARQHLVMPGDSAGVDFRAACFCHRRIVDIGFVCSICLSIFCEVLADGQCLTCGSELRMTNYGNKPAVVPKKKLKKKKRAVEGGDITMSGTATPV